MNTIAIPAMTPLTIPDGATIESMKEGLPMSAYCRYSLTTANFGMGESPCRKLLGGFLAMPDDFLDEAGVQAVTELARATGRKFRLGTPLEALAYRKSGATHPKWWLVLNKKVSAFVLGWSNCGVDPGFSLNNWGVFWASHCEVFVVEEPET